MIYMVYSIAFWRLYQFPVSSILFEAAVSYIGWNFYISVALSWAQFYFSSVFSLVLPDMQEEEYERLGLRPLGREEGSATEPTGQKIIGLVKAEL